MSALDHAADGECLDQHVEDMPVRCPHTAALSHNTDGRCERNAGHDGPHRLNATWGIK